MTKEIVRDEIVYTATEARTKFSDLFDAAHFGKRVVVRKHQREVALVSMDVLDRLNQLFELEALVDSLQAEIALGEFHKKGGKTMKQIKQELDME